MGSFCLWSLIKKIHPRLRAKPAGERSVITPSLPSTNERILMVSDSKPARTRALAREWALIRRTLTFTLALLLSLPWVGANAAIAVSKGIASGHTSVILPGDVTAFHITLTNDDPTSTITGVAFADNMAAAGIKIAGVGLVSNTCNGVVTATVGSSLIQLTGGTIPAAGGGGALGSCDIVVEVTSTAMGTSPQNVIPANAVQGDDKNAVTQKNGSPAVQSFSVLSMTPPLIRKSFAPTTVVQNDQVATLKIEVENTSSSGNLPLTTVTDNLPANVTFVSATAVHFLGRAHISGRLPSSTPEDAGHSGWRAPGRERVHPAHRSKTAASPCGHIKRNWSDPPPIRKPDSAPECMDSCAETTIPWQ